MRSRLVAWLALLTTLFSAASPTFAAALLPHEPAALARMLGIPAAAAQPAVADEHAHHGAHHAPTHESSGGDKEPDHAAHGVYCTFCLNPSSIATIAAAPVAAIVLDLKFGVSSVDTQTARSTPFHPPYRSRAPPRVS